MQKYSIYSYQLALILYLNGSIRIRNTQKYSIYSYQLALILYLKGSIRIRNTCIIHRSMDTALSQHHTASATSCHQTCQRYKKKGTTRLPFSSYPNSFSQIHSKSTYHIYINMYTKSVLYYKITRFHRKIVLF